MKPVFFYGLFMDEDLLRAKGLNPNNIRLAALKDYELKIGARATLVPAVGACAYGTVMELDSNELQSLYSGDGVEDYVPETVQINVIKGPTVEASTYILPVEKLSGSNSEYAAKLADVAKKLALPDDYVGEIKGWI